MIHTLSPEEIKALLEEAAQPLTTEDRVQEIGTQLIACVWGNDDTADLNQNSTATGFLLLFRTLWTNSHEEMLPALYPFFLILCGPRKEGKMLREDLSPGETIDWADMIQRVSKHLSF